MKGPGYSREFRLFYFTEGLGISLVFLFFFFFPFQFSKHVFSQVVTWPAKGQSHMPFRCLWKALWGLGRVLSALQAAELSATHLARLLIYVMDVHG